MGRLFSLGIKTVINAKGLFLGLLLQMFVGYLVSRAHIAMWIAPNKGNNDNDNDKVNRCLARYSPRATTTNRPTNRAPNKPAWPGPN